MADSIRHLAGKCEGMRIERDGQFVSVIDRYGVRLIERDCRTGTAARKNASSLADYVYWLADRGAFEVPTSTQPE